MNSYYVAGGTLHPEAECYIERDADRALFDGLLRGDFCYVLTSRQMGKSSLMARTAYKLRKRGFEVVMIDLTAVGQNVSCEQWYDGLVMQIAEQLDLEDEVESFWQDQKRLSPIQRFIRSLTHVVLESIQDNLIIFIDEIDVVLSLPFSADELFGAIRECYNRRNHEPKFQRLDFCLLGVASPVDLISDSNFSPFNAGNAITLRDFTLQETEDLGAGLDGDQGALWYVSHQIYLWTKGHPYLTLRLYKAMAKLPVIHGIEDVDAQSTELFLSEKSLQEDANLIFVNSWLVRSKVDQVLAETLELVRSLVNERKVAYDSSDTLQKWLLLSGVAKVDAGRVIIRNLIYQRVFSEQWISRNFPAQLAAPPKSPQVNLVAWIPYVRAIAIVLMLVVVGGVMVQKLIKKEPGNHPVDNTVLVVNQNRQSEPPPEPESQNRIDRVVLTDAEVEAAVNSFDGEVNEEMLSLARRIWEWGGSLFFDGGQAASIADLPILSGNLIWVNLTFKTQMPPPEALRNLPNHQLIGWVSLNESAVTDEHLSAICSWANLKKIELMGGRVQVSNRGLRFLSQCPELHEISLSLLDDQTLSVLAESCPKLGFIGLDHVHIQRSNIQTLGSMNIGKIAIFNSTFSNEGLGVFDVMQMDFYLRWENIHGAPYFNQYLHTLPLPQKLVSLELVGLQARAQDLDVLSNMPQLKRLTFYTCGFINPRDVEKLKVSELESLDFISTPIPEEVVRNLQQGTIKEIVAQ